MVSGPEQRARFCQVCGSAMESRHLFGRQRMACTNAACGFVLFEATAAVVGALVVQRQEVLLIRRAIPPGKGLWGFPAGFQDYGESPADTARREVREETGLQIELDGVFDVVHTDSNPRKLINLIVYLARPVAGELQAGDDAAEARFFDLEALPDDLAFDNNRTLLERLRAMKRNDAR